MRILIVEDEAESREGLRAMLLKIHAGSDPLMAANAEAALRILDQNRMDLIFLDIRMPGMDGLTLLGKIRARDPDVPVAILSAYDQFSCAQQAIRLGVLDYIVKPYTEQSIRQVLGRVREGGDAFLLPDLSNWILNPELYADLIANRLRLDPSLPCPGRLYLLKARCRAAAEEPTALDRARRSAMEALIRQVKASLAPGAHVLLLEVDGLFPMVLLGVGACELDEALLKALFESVCSCYGFEISCAAGAVQSDILRSIRLSYTRCKALLDQAFYLPAGSVVTEGLVQMDPKKEVDRILLQEAKTHILKGDAQGAHACLLRMEGELLTPPYMPVQRLLYTLHIEFITLLTSAGPNLTEERRMELDEKMRVLAQSDCRADEFFEGYRLLAAQLAAYVQDLSANRNNATIKLCLEYLSEHYGIADLTQDKMARKFHFSVGYFGNMFKAVTGESFVRYLNRLRILKARELLESTDLKVYEIARQTGFVNVNYFIRVFNRQVQMSPNRYRTLYAARRIES